MDIGVLRDFVIVIGGFLLLFVIILTAILGFFIYRDVKSLITSIKSTINTAKQMGANVGEAVKLFKDFFTIFKAKETKNESKPSEVCR